MNGPFRPLTRILITPGASTAENFHTLRSELLETVRLAVAVGIEAVQIREKALPSSLLLELVLASVELTKGSSANILVNERFDVAMSAEAHGVHLPSNSIPIDIVRRLLPEHMMLGVSAHSFEEAAKAHERGADYAIVGPLFATPGKGEPLRVAKFSELCSALAPFPIIAVGGIDATNQETAMGAGASGIAAIRYLNDFVRIGQ